MKILLYNVVLINWSTSDPPLGGDGNIKYSKMYFKWFFALRTSMWYVILQEEAKHFLRDKTRKETPIQPLTGCGAVYSIVNRVPELCSASTVVVTDAAEALLSLTWYY